MPETSSKEKIPSPRQPAETSTELSVALARAENAESRLAEIEPLAEAGRFALDSRHEINNTLSSVLGNAELLLVEPEAVSPQAREQIRAIHKMTLRLYELVQQISAVEKDVRQANAAAQVSPKRARALLNTHSPEKAENQPYPLL
jgi:signal transduction histidine kinase